MATLPTFISIESVTLTILHEMCVYESAESALLIMLPIFKGSCFLLVRSSSRVKRTSYTRDSIYAVILLLPVRLKYTGM